MNILENNRNILSNLYEQYKESFNGLSMEGNYLVYKGQKTDISEFNLERLINENDTFVTSLSVLSAEDIFRIIRLHTEMIKSPLELDSQTNKENKESQLEIIKSENPLMKNINIVSRTKNGYKEEFITIVDSTGKPHMFRNDYNINIFVIYENLKYRHPGQDITPDELIQEINRKLHEIQLNNVSEFQNRDTVSEDFEQKMKRVNSSYKNDKMHNVYGNEENDIAIVEDLQNGTKSRVITFTNNESGDLLLQSHGGNVSGTDTIQKDQNSFESSNLESSVDDSQTEFEKFENDHKEQEIRLISTQEFYNLLDSSKDLNEMEQAEVDLYYAYLGDLILYEDYLLEELKAILNSFRAYVTDLQIKESTEESIPLNNKQQNAIEKLTELETKKQSKTSDLSYEKVEENIKKLVLQNPNVSNDNAASVSIIQVIAFVIGVSIILTAVTLYLLK